MKIGFDAKRAFNNFTGLGNYARTLLTSLAELYRDHDYYLYTTEIQENEETKEIGNLPFKVKTPPHLFKAYWRSFEILDQLKRDDIQLYHGLSNELPVNIHKSGIKSIITIHDLIFKENPEWYPWTDRKIYEVKFRYACQQADHVVAISESTKADIIRHYHIPEDKITVVYQSCHEKFYYPAEESALSTVSRKYKLPERYLLYVGSIIERKNLLAAVKALPLLAADLRIPLVVVGSGKKYQQKVKAWIAANNLNDHVIWLDQVRNVDLPAIYQQAEIFLYPSFYEGFGIPVMEALYSRTPVITSNTSSLREAGGPASWYVDPGQPEQITYALEQILSDGDKKDKMIEDGFAYVQKFHRKKVTGAMMDLYQKIMQ